MCSVSIVTLTPLPIQSKRFYHQVRELFFPSLRWVVFDENLDELSLSRCVCVKVYSSWRLAWFSLLQLLVSLRNGNGNIDRTHSTSQLKWANWISENKANMPTKTPFIRRGRRCALISDGNPTFCLGRHLDVGPQHWVSLSRFINRWLNIMRKDKLTFIFSWPPTFTTCHSEPSYSLFDER